MLSESCVCVCVCVCDIGAGGGSPSQRWLREQLGALAAPGLINLVLSRAQRGLILLGNAELLSVHPAWNRVVQVCHSHATLRASSPGWNCKGGGGFYLHHPTSYCMVRVCVLNSGWPWL